MNRWRRGNMKRRRGEWGTGGRGGGVERQGGMSVQSVAGLMTGCKGSRESRQKRCSLATDGEGRTKSTSQDGEPSEACLISMEHKRAYNRPHLVN